MTTPAPIGRRGLAVRAALEGKAAAQAGEPVQACPYAASRPFTRRAWLLGFVAGRPPGELEVDPDPGAPGDPLED